MKVFIVLAACMAAGSALDVGVRSSIFDCPEVNVVEDFDIDSFSGTWYQQAYSLGSEMSQGYSTCGVAEWTKVNATTLFMDNKQKGLIGNLQEVKGYAVLENPTQGNFTTTFKTFWGTHTYQLKVLSTDYTTYAITYSCAKVLGFPLEAAWITTRVQTASGDEYDQLEARIKAAIDTVYGLHYSDFHKTKQTGCS